MQTTSLIFYSFCYFMMFIQMWLNKDAGNCRLINENGEIDNNPINIICNFLICIFWMGFLPAIFLDLPVLKIFIGTKYPASYLLFIYLLLLLFFALLAIKISSGVQLQPTIAGNVNKHLSVFFITSYFMVRTAFLFAYEMFFRGFLLFYCIDVMGVTFAIAVNTLLHMFLHSFNSKKEMLACIPFSVLACLLSIIFGAVWPAIILHITFSIVYEVNLYRSYCSSPKIIHV